MSERTGQTGVVTALCLLPAADCLKKRSREMKKALMIAMMIGVIGMAGVANADIATGLTTHYEFNVDTLETDLGYNSKTASTDALGGTGTLTQTAGPGGSITNGATFPATGRYIVVGAGPAVGNGDVSYTAWFNTNNGDDHMSVIHGTGGGDHAILEVVSGDPETFIRDNDDLLADIWLQPGPSQNDGEWHFMAGTWDGTTNTATLYVDDNAGDTDSSPTGSVDITSSDWTVGSRSGSVLPFEGSLADVRIYDRVLSADDVGELYALGSAAPIPEPAGLGLLGVALLAMRRKRRAL